MDNAAFHKRADIQELLEQQGHKILWLPVNGILKLTPFTLQMAK
ncbi:hypothetical protein [Acinetobacter brisouii]